MKKFPLVIPFTIVIAASIFSLVTQTMCQVNCVLGAVQTPTPPNVIDVSPVPYPQFLATRSSPNISAQSGIVIDANSKKVLFAKNARLRFSPASTVKIMTALIAVETYPPQQYFISREKMSGNGSTMRLVAQEEISVENLLYGLLLNSGNDAAVVLAQNFPNGQEAFVTRMNEKANELHLTDTHYRDPAGLDDDGNFSSAFDLAILASEALENEALALIFSTREKNVSDKTGKIVHKLQNLNKLLGHLYGANGVKTGTTIGAGEVLVASTKRDGHTIVSVVMKSDDRFDDTTKLIDWTFENFQFIDVSNSQK